MMDTWDSLTDEKKAELVAMKVWGWHRGKRRISDDSRGTPCWFLRDESGRYPEEVMKHVCARYRPTENIAQAWEVQARIAHLSLELEWAAMLITLDGISQAAPDRCDWILATATADQRCHAAVLAVERKQQ